MDFVATAPQDWVSESTTAGDIRQIREFLTAQGTFHFPTLPNGLFSAAAGEGEAFEATGYRNVWVRDNIHIAHAHWVTGQTAVAARCMRTLFDYFQKHRQRLTSCIQGVADPSDPMNRPHIRFDGANLAELDEKWSHAQNDALGYFMWLSCRMTTAGDLQLFATDVLLLCELAAFWKKVQFWEDEDSGHWEETRKVSASSIGVAVAGLLEFQKLLQAPHVARLADSVFPQGAGKLVETLISYGQSALAAILPAECRQPDLTKQRRFDSALLFLIFPLRLVQGDLAELIVSQVREHLQGSIGIRRYLGDSYWCADYKTLLSADSRTSDFSDDLGSRDRLLKPGTEAQWCIFDPIISVIQGERYSASGAALALVGQREALVRSLQHLTTASPRFPAFRCPESYFLEGGTWVPNDITPLLWTQANLLLALDAMERSLARAD